jgi:glutathione S-transferase
MHGMKTDRLCATGSGAYTGAMKLYRFVYSPYARKVQTLLELLGRPHVAVDVPYSDRNELATLTGGYIQVPVIVDDDGTVVCDSPRICAHLLQGASGAELLPATLAGPIWAYHDWCDNLLEDVMFRIGSPAVRDRWPSAGDRALYVFIKERKFGRGCVDQWLQEREALIGRANALLEPTRRTLSTQPFVFGARPTLADAALYGEFAMLAAADASLLLRFPEELRAWITRVDAAAAERRAR